MSRTHLSPALKAARGAVDGSAVPWTAPPTTELPPAAQAFRAQWQLQHGPGSVPDLLALLGGNEPWLFALLHARCHAAGSPRALAIFGAYERELARITGHTPTAWPAAFDLCPALRDVGALPQLNPGQAMLVTAGLRGGDAATRALLAVLLDRAFGGELPPGRLTGERRVALLAAASRGPQSHRWAREAGLEAPSAASPTVAAGRRLLDAAFCPARGDDQVCEAQLDNADPISLGEALDLVCAALTVRAALRAAGDLPISSPDWATAPAANDALGYGPAAPRAAGW